MGEPFATPLVYVNSTGFGPTTLPERFKDVPFVTFTKWDNLGRVANFGNFPLGKDHQRFMGTGSKFDDKKALFGGTAPQTVAVTQAEDDFELVDTTRTETRKGPKVNFRRPNAGGAFGANRRGGGQRGGRGGQLTRDAAIRGEPEPNQPQLKGKQAKFLLQGMRRGKQWNKRGNQGFGRRRDFNEREMIKEASIKIKANWEVVDSLEIPKLQKTQVAVPNADEYASCGSLHKYDDSYDKITLRSTKPFKMATDRSFVYAGTLEDPVIEKLISERKGNVFATDEILAYLMTLPRSVKTWDLVFTRVGDMLFIDKREDSALEALTVNETFTGGISEKDEARLKAPYNAPDKLSLEATAINQSFLMQVLKRDEVVKEAEPSPFTTEENELPHQPILYTYKGWQLGSYKIVARTETHVAAVSKATPNQPEKRINVYALNEFDSKVSGNVDWRLKLDTQMGAVMANELKNNAAKVARWTVQSLLSGADSIKLGFVSRVTPTDPTKHVVLGVNTVRPRDLAAHINLNERNIWGIVRAIIDMVWSKGAGKFVLLRDPNKALVTLYKVPMNTFEEDDEEGEDEEELEDEDDGEMYRQVDDDELDEDED